MHELSIAHAVVSTVTAALPDSDTRVLEVRLRVGALSGVVTQALEFAYDVAAQGTPLADAVLVVERVPVTVYCADCDAVGPLPGAYTFACPTCGRPTGDVRSGNELEVASIVLADEAAGEAADEMAGEVAGEVAGDRSGGGGPR